MATKKTAWLIYFILFFSVFLNGQTTDFFIERETRFIQRLSWTADEYALRYEVEIEREDAGTYHRHLLESTNESFILVSLPPGNYRYRVLPYNLLNRPGRISEWLEIVIVRALDPQLAGFSPELFILNRDRDYILRLYGDNLISQDEIYLLHRNGNIIRPAEIQLLYDGKEAHLLFTRDQLSEGMYQIYIRNPGGLEASISGFVIYNENAERTERGGSTASLDGTVSPLGLHIYIGANWFTFIDLQGKSSSTEQFLSGMGLRISAVSSNLSYFNIGLEFVPAWYSLNSLLGSKEAAPSSKAVKSVLLESNFLLQKQFLDNNLALTFRIGTGLIMPIENSVQDGSFVYANTGLSLLWMLLERLYLEAGINYSYLFEINNYSSHLRPWLNIGIRF